MIFKFSSDLPIMLQSLVLTENGRATEDQVKASTKDLNLTTFDKFMMWLTKEENQHIVGFIPLLLFSPIILYLLQYLNLAW